MDIIALFREVHDAFKKRFLTEKNHKNLPPFSNEYGRGEPVRSDGELLVLLMTDKVLTRGLESSRKDR